MTICSLIKIVINNIFINIKKQYYLCFTLTLISLSFKISNIELASLNSTISLAFKSICLSKFSPASASRLLLHNHSNSQKHQSIAV